jgi:hypothetical protein
LLKPGIVSVMARRRPEDPLSFLNLASGGALVVEGRIGED